MPVKKEVGEEGNKWLELIPRGRAVHAGSFVLKVFLSLLQLGTLGEFSGEDLNKIFISCPGMSFQGPGQDWLVLWQSITILASGPDFSHGVSMQPEPVSIGAACQHQNQ